MRDRTRMGIVVMILGAMIDITPEDYPTMDYIWIECNSSQKDDIAIDWFIGREPSTDAKTNIKTD